MRYCEQRYRREGSQSFAWEPATGKENRYVPKQLNTNRQDAKQSGIFTLLHGIAITHGTADRGRLCRLHICEVASHAKADETQNRNDPGPIRF
jgi:hypothetical protein